MGVLKLSALGVKTFFHRLKIDGEIADIKNKQQKLYASLKGKKITDAQAKEWNDLECRKILLKRKI